MKLHLKRLAFRTLSTKNYLRLLQRGYFFAYRFGLLKNTEEYKYHYFVRRLIHQGDYILDIGANLGYYSKLFSRWAGPRGKVFSVEPIRIYNEIFREATRHCKNITLYPYALGLEEKEITLVAPLHNGYMHTGLPHVYNPQKDGQLNEQELTFPAQMKIPSKLFNNLEKLNYIKCDIEGFEAIVLNDLKEIIARHQPIVQVEVWNQNRQEVLQLFGSLGYNAYQLQNRKLTAYEKLPADFDGDFIFIPQTHPEINRLTGN